jgi:uncharacterized protein YdeI (YjbR/CyaY-like superfamily)
MSAPRAFASAAKFRAWLEKHHASATELEVRLFKVHAAHRGMGYVEALDEALCFGWIDGVRHSIDADCHQVRFTPRRPGSRWSLVNIRHAKRLEAAGRMHAAGLAAFRNRDEQDSRRYSFEARSVALSAAFARKFRAARRAWAFFEAQAPWYRRVCTHWIMSAKRPETRERRLASLIELSENQRPLPGLERAVRKPGAAGKSGAAGKTGAAGKSGAAGKPAAAGKRSR